MNILSSEAFLIVISGVVIFSVQKIISELWIRPLVRFFEVRGKLEVLILRYSYLSQVSLGVSDRTDSEIFIFKDSLRELAGELIAYYNTLPFLEKFWIEKVKRIKVKDSKKSLIQLSNIVATPSDVNKPVTLASEVIDRVKIQLKLID